MPALPKQKGSGRGTESRAGNKCSPGSIDVVFPTHCHSDHTRLPDSWLTGSLPICARKGLEKLPCDLSLSAKLLLIERVLKPANEPAPGKFIDLQGLVVSSGGRERAEADYQTLLREASFILERVIPTIGPLSINESRPL